MKNIYDDSFLRLQPVEQPEKEELPLEAEQKFHVLLIVSDKERTPYLESALSNNFQISFLDDFKKLDKEMVSEEVDLIIVDEWVGTTYGGDLCAQIKQDEKMTEVPVILLVESDDDESYLLHSKCGANRVLCRYTNLRIIMADIEMLINNSCIYRQKILKLTAEKFTEDFPGINVNDWKNQRFINKVFNLIEKHPLAEKYPVPELARDAQMGKTCFYTKVKEITGKSPIKLITAYKMKKAEEIIRNGESDITNVAIMVGYTDVRYFAKQFKKIYNICPSKYLQSLN